jgi:hypothetical protein
MLGRRRHERFQFTQPPEGVLRLRLDVAVHGGSDGTLTAVGESPGIVGELLTLHVMGAGASASLAVEVLESRPQIIGGTLRHALRLQVVSGLSAAEPGWPA